MQRTKFERMALATFFLTGWLIGVGGAIEHAQAQTVNPVPPPPPPVFNPIPPNTTVPQPSVAPVSPGTPSTLPGSEAVSPSEETVPSTATRSHERAVTSTPETPSVAQKRTGRHVSTRHHWRRESYAGTAVRCPCYFPPYAWGDYPLDYGPACVWHREWDGRWFNHCI